MTDHERLIELLTSFGIEPDQGKPGFVTLRAKQGNVEGYMGFLCQFAFDSDGKFLDVSIWE